MIEHIIDIIPIFNALMIIPLVTFITTYTISSINETQVYPYYFLSSSIDTKPSSSIGTFGIALVSMIMPIISTVRYEYVKHHIIYKNVINKNNSIKVNKKALKSSVVSSIGALGVASFQDGIDKCGGTFYTRFIHLLFSFIFFSGGLYHGYYVYKLDTLLPELGTTVERRVRKLLYYCLIIQLTLQPLNILLFMDKPSDVIIFILSILEIILFVTVSAFYYTFYNEMKKTQLKIKVITEPNSVNSL